MPRGQDRDLLSRKRKNPEQARLAARDDDGSADVGGSLPLAWLACKPEKKHCASGRDEDEEMPDLSIYQPREVKAIMSKRVMDAFKRGDDDACRQQMHALNSLMVAGHFRLRHDLGACV